MLCQSIVLMDSDSLAGSSGQSDVTGIPLGLAETTIDEQIIHNRLRFLGCLPKVPYINTDIEGSGHLLST
jgi:hypothetical protein